jgi:16S rRNA (cytidine1402-2'-O)-methyltransferase
METFGDRPAVLARELTKLHEEFARGSISQIIQSIERRQVLKGECTLLVGGASERAPSEDEIDAAIASAVAGSYSSLSDLTKALSRRLGVSRKTIYAKALALKKER